MNTDGMPWHEAEHQRPVRNKLVGGWDGSFSDASPATGQPVKPKRAARGRTPKVQNPVREFDVVGYVLMGFMKRGLLTYCK